MNSLVTSSALVAFALVANVAAATPPTVLICPDLSKIEFFHASSARQTGTMLDIRGSGDEQYVVGRLAIRGTDITSLEIIEKDYRRFFDSGEIREPAGPALADDPPSKVVRYSALRVHFSEDARERVAEAIAEVASANQPYRSTEAIAIVMNGVPFAAPYVPRAFRPEAVDVTPSREATLEAIVAFMKEHLNCSVAAQRAAAERGDRAPVFAE